MTIKQGIEQALEIADRVLLTTFPFDGDGWCIGCSGLGDNRTLEQDHKENCDWVAYRTLRQEMLSRGVINDQG